MIMLDRVWKMLQEIDATEHTQLLPGDVLRIQRTILPGALGIGSLEQTSLTMPASAKQ